MSKPIKRDEVAFYEIRVQGVLDERWSEWLDGLDVRPLEIGETLLTGPTLLPALRGRQPTLTTPSVRPAG